MKRLEPVSTATRVRAAFPDTLSGYSYHLPPPAFRSVIEEIETDRFGLWAADPTEDRIVDH